MDDEIDVTCPFCGEPGTVEVDLSGGRRQSFVRDCDVCCRPWEVRVIIQDGEAQVTVNPG